jgi:hypothetical protein
MREILRGMPHGSSDRSTIHPTSICHADDFTIEVTIEVSYLSSDKPAIDVTLLNSFRHSNPTT